MFLLKLFEGRREKSDDCFFVAAVKRLFKGNDKKVQKYFETSFTQSQKKSEM